nr:putative reverse transcriptase domain-containing protein [Tanacetum cinerariifolium]
EELSNVHNNFHISNLKKCLSDESLVIPTKELRLDDKLNFVEEPIEIMDEEVKQLGQSRIPIFKVRRNSKRGPEFTWERKDQIRAKTHKFVCHWANPVKDFKWSNVPRVKLSLLSKSDDTFSSLQALSNLHYLSSSFMDYLWSRQLNISNFGPANW